MSNFADLGLSEAALAAVERLGYENPTPVQEQSIPFILEGRDIIAAASTGTGKTAAFLLPTLSTLPRLKGRRRAPRVLVVSPTRELAQQIAQTCMQISRKTGHFVTTVFGGTPYGPQINELRGGTDVLIATPGRLNDLMNKGVVDLGSIETLVLDEADRMLDMGFLPAVTTIVDATPECRQTLLFSATIDHSIQRNLGTLLNNPAIIEIARNGETAKTVEQFMMPIANRDKSELLHAVLDEKGSDRVIVFARTKNRTEECAEELRHAGYSAESIHSDKSQGQRRRALDNFRRGKTSVLVATDVLARGIDVPDVDHVINFDLPDMPEDYIHRIGRTGRAGEQGYAISFVTRESHRTLKDIEKLIGKDIPFMPLENYKLDQSVLEKGKKGGSYKGAGKGGRSYGNNRATSSDKRTGSFSRGSGRSDDRRSSSDSRSQDDRPGRSNRFDSRSDNRPSSRPESKRSDNRFDSKPADNKRSEGKRADSKHADAKRVEHKHTSEKHDESRGRNSESAKLRLERKDKHSDSSQSKSYEGAPKAGKHSGSKKAAHEGGYNYSRFTNSKPRD